MKVGMFSDVVGGGSPEEIAERTRALGAETVQVRPAWPGLDLQGSAADRVRVRRAYEAAGVEIAALAGYTNLVDPRPEQRRANYASLERLISIAVDLGAHLVVTETGSYDAAWHDHPRNRTPEAWAELGDITGRLVAACERAGATLVYEPYVNTVLASARDARRLAAEIASPALAFVFDSAGLTTAKTITRNGDITAEALDLLRGRIALAHAGDVRYEDGEPLWLPLGWGDLDTRAVLDGLATAGFDGALIVEHAAESLVAEALAYCRTRWRRGQEDRIHTFSEI